MTTGPEVVQPGTLALLRTLMSDERLGNFFLVGGTALALRYGHRLSIDLDLFTPEAFDANAVEELVSREYGFRTRDKSTNGLVGTIAGVKVDFLSHRYALVEPVEQADGLRLASALDIAAMKLNAISGNGTRAKDFYDVYMLLEHFSLDAILAAYTRKYPHSTAVLAARSLTYFDDVDHATEPAVMVEPVDFAAVRARLQAAVVDPGRVFK